MVAGLSAMRQAGIAGLAGADGMRFPTLFPAFMFDDVGSLDALTRRNRLRHYPQDRFGDISGRGLFNCQGNGRWRFRSVQKPIYLRDAHGGRYRGTGLLFGMCYFPVGE